MQQFTVTGLSCAACQAKVEKAVSSVPGVRTCAVSLLTNRMSVEGTATAEAVIQAVTKAGYGAFATGSAPKGQSPEKGEILQLHKRLWSSLAFLLVLFYLSMGHSLWGWPLPFGLAQSPVALGLTQMLLAALVMVINQKFFISGFRSALHGAPNMDTLVSLGSAASFLRSVWTLYGLILAPGTDQNPHFYFESAAMILVLITVGKLLEAHSKGKTTNALKALMRLAPQKAHLIREEQELTVPVEAVRPGDVFAVYPGESIPVDGVILEGITAVNEAAMTGESIPKDKGAGDEVSASTVNGNGFIRCRATRVGEDTALAQIIRLVSDASATKAPIAKTADTVAGYFVPAVVGIAAITLTVWLLLGKTADFALSRAIAVLVISCPCALGLATPVAIMVGNGVGAQNGILYKTASALENTGKTEIVVLDKTGTLTTGEPAVTALVPAEGISEQALLQAAFTLEKQSEHPLARAIVGYGEQKGLVADAVSGFTALPGNGLKAERDGKTLWGGSLRYAEQKAAVGEAMRAQVTGLSEKGYTPLLFFEDNVPLGVIAVADALKEDSARAVEQMQNMGIPVVMLTGDDRRTAEAMGAQAGIRHIVAEVLPAQKSDVIRRLAELGKVTMVGDGINDAPALTVADTGIALGAGTDVAMDAADVVLMHSRLTDVAAAIRLSRATLTNIRQNLFWAFFYNALCIPLAAGCFTGLLHWELNPMVGAAAMSLSGFCVVSNALRLNRFRVHLPRYGKKRKHCVDEAVLKTVTDQFYVEREETTMITKKLKIEGMMCPHCEAHTKKALEAVEGVQSAVADFQAGCATVTLDRPVDDAVLQKAVEDAGYKVITE